MSPEEFAEVQRNIKAGLSLNADLQLQQVTLLKNIQALLRGVIIIGGVLICLCVMAVIATANK